MTSLLRQVATHEAAHAVVAAHYGMRVTEIRVGQRDGATVHTGNGTRLQLAAVTAAGEVGQRLAAAETYEDLACSDLARFEAEHGLGLLWRAQQDARAILTSRRRAFMQLIMRLESERHVRFSASASV
ncbi:M50 family metallopeptidase [Actinocorallia longicatena]|uniref:Peptidase M41-like protein n=1 Tax=Actinocorallia longicatena TaxID=111803 RepID=A0ABP6QGJ2_9ACTN